MSPPPARLLALCFALLCPLAPAPSARAQITRVNPAVDSHLSDIAAARAAAETWLRRVDAGEYGASWQEAAPYFKGITTEAHWTDLLGNVRLPLGKPVGRASAVEEFSVVMPGMPDGAYVFLQFQTEFERKKTTVETVTCLRDADGRWKVAGYFIK